MFSPLWSHTFVLFRQQINLHSSIDLCAGSGSCQRHTQQDIGYHWVSSTYAKRISWMFIRLTNCPLCCSECNISPTPGVELFKFATTVSSNPYLIKFGQQRLLLGLRWLLLLPVNAKVLLLLFANRWSLFTYFGMCTVINFLMANSWNQKNEESEMCCMAVHIHKAWVFLIIPSVNKTANMGWGIYTSLLPPPSKLHIGAALTA